MAVYTHTRTQTHADTDTHTDDEQRRECVVWCDTCFSQLAEPWIISLPSSFHHICAVISLPSSLHFGNEVEMREDAIAEASAVASSMMMQHTLQHTCS